MIATAWLLRFGTGANLARRATASLLDQRIDRSRHPRRSVELRIDRVVSMGRPNTDKVGLHFSGHGVYRGSFLLLLTIAVAHVG